MKKSNLTIRTGFVELDKLTGGLNGGDLVCIASRPSMGKTALAQNIAAHVAFKKRIPVLFFSLDLNRYSLVQRLIAAEAKVNLKDIRTGYFRRDRWQDLTTAAERFCDVPLYINDSPGIDSAELKFVTHEVIGLMECLFQNKTKDVAARSTETALRTNGRPAMAVADIRVIVHRLQSQLRQELSKEFGLVVIDSVQSLRGTSRGEARQHELSEISHDLKGLARELEIPVIALAQLSSAWEDKTRTDNKPMLSDLSESGSLEQDADLVALIHCPGYYKRNDPTLEDKAEIIVAKNPRGKTGTVTMKFESEYVKFSAWSDPCPPEQGPYFPEHGPFAPF